jgi:hypothetical protein
VHKVIARRPDAAVDQIAEHAHVGHEDQRREKPPRIATLRVANERQRDVGQPLNPQ